MSAPAVLPASRIEDLASCNLDFVWLWTEGHVDKRTFKGQCLARLNRFDYDVADRKDEVIRARVKHGWVFTVAGDMSGCGGDFTTYLVEEMPNVEDGRWDGAVTYDEDDEEQPAEVVDSPRPATWLELA